MLILFSYKQTLCHYLPKGRTPIVVNPFDFLQEQFVVLMTHVLIKVFHIKQNSYTEIKFKLLKLQYNEQIIM